MSNVIGHPNDIERDFTHLADDFDQSLNHALLVNVDFIQSGYNPGQLQNHLKINDIRGSAPGVSLSALIPIWSDVNIRESTSQLIERWCKAYLLRLADFAYQYREAHNLAIQLERLAENIAQWEMHPSIREHFHTLGLSALDLEAINRVQRLCAEAISARVKQPSRVVQRPKTFAALWGKEKAERVRIVLRQLGMTHPPLTNGRRLYIAAFHAACDLYVHPRRLGDWRFLLEDFFPGTGWGKEIKPHRLQEADEEYIRAYKVMMAELKYPPGREE